MKALIAASRFRAAFSARSWWRGVVIGFKRVIVAAPWFCATAALLERGGELHRFRETTFALLRRLINDIST